MDYDYLFRRPSLSQASVRVKFGSLHNIGHFKSNLQFMKICRIGNIKHVFLRLALVSCCVFFGNIVRSQDLVKATAMADTSYFTAKETTKWQVLNSYIYSKKQGYATLEVTVAIIDRKFSLSSELYVGRIKNAQFFPKESRLVGFRVLDVAFELRIEPSGLCYIKHISGKPEGKIGAAIPIVIDYQL
jgi:hypothetical protein